MPGSCQRRNPITRSGTNQSQRLLRALSADYFRIDERDTTDLILFAQRFARHIRYYDIGNQPAGDWTPFFSSDITAVLAGMSELPIESFQRFARTLQQYLLDDEGRSSEDLGAHLQLLFYLPLMLLVDVGRYYNRLAANDPLQG